MRFSLYGLLVGIATFTVWTLFEFFLRRETAAKKWHDSTWTLGLLFVAGGALVGARAYHVITDWALYAARPWPAVLAVWNGGLGWYGGLLGVIAALWIWRSWQKPSVPWLPILDALALSLPWGQALGRWGNYFNQELFGPPTNLPWGVFIEPRLRPEVWQNFERFHPLFLYESVGSLGLGVGLYAMWRWSQKQTELPWVRFGSGTYFTLYGLGFGSLRFVLDFLRPDLQTLGILSVSQWASLLLIIGSVVLLKMSLGRWIQGLAVAGVLALLFTPQLVHAQDSGAPVDLSFTPSVVEIVVKPGKGVTRAFTLKNQGTTNLNTTISLRDFVSDNATGAPVILEKSAFPYASLLNNDRALNESFLLPADQEQQLVLSLTIPEDAPQQDWYLILLASTEPVQRDPLVSSRASSQGAIGATLLIRISDTETIPLQWGVSFPTLPHFFDSLRPLTIEPLVENMNPTLAVPVLSVSVRNWRGELVHTQAGLPERILAKSTRVLRAQQVSGDDARSLEPTPFLFDPLLALGPYTVEATITNQAGQPLRVTQKVWGVPFSLILGSLSLIFILTFFSVFQRKSPKRPNEEAKP